MSYTNHIYRGTRMGLDPDHIRITVDGFEKAVIRTEDADWGFYGGAVKELAMRIAQVEFNEDREVPAGAIKSLYHVLAKITADHWEFDSHYLRTLLDLSAWDPSNVHVHHFREYQPSRIRLTLADYTAPGGEGLVMVGSALYNPRDQKGDWRSMGEIDGKPGTWKIFDKTKRSEGSRAGGRAAAVEAVYRLYTSFVAGLIKEDLYPNSYYMTTDRFHDMIKNLRQDERSIDQYSGQIVERYRLAARGHYFGKPDK